jgi:hypothetical protein
MPTPNVPAGGSPVTPILIHLSGQYTTSRTAVSTFKLPFAAKLIGVCAAARVSGGTTPTLTVNVKDDGVSVLTSAVSVTGGAAADASIDSTKAQIADESVMTIDLTIGGTSPTWDDIDVLLTFVRV